MSLRDEIIEKMKAASSLSKKGAIYLSDREYGILADAALAALRPHDAVADSQPLILYFPTKEARAGAIKDILEVSPNLKAVEV